MGTLPGSGSLLTDLDRQRRSRLGTIAKTVSGQRSGSAMGFRNRTRTRSYPPKKRQRTPEEMSAARVRRFALQSTAGRILPGQRVNKCLRAMVPTSQAVEVGYVPDTHSSHYRNLQVCSSVWHCPICSATISERRRDELARMIEKHTQLGGSVYMTTYTISHHSYHDLRDLLSRFLAARRKMRQGRRGQALRNDFGVIGTVSVLEVTWSEENGWHPHVHELVFCGNGSMDEDGYEQAARSAWEDAAAAMKLSMNKHGFKLDRTYGAVADYIAKYGREPAADTTPWGVETEMVKGHLKQGRTNEHYSPFAMLAAIHDGGRADLEPKFREYALCFKGRKQLTYSPGLKALYQEDEKTDEELMLEHEHDALTLLELHSEQWDQVCGNDIRGELLEEARSGRPGRVLSYLEDFGIEVYPEQYTRFEGWRVISPVGAGTIGTVTRCDVLQRWRCSVILDQAQENNTTWRAFDLTEVQVLDSSADDSDTG